MPNYDFRCTRGHIFDYFTSFADVDKPIRCRHKGCRAQARYAVISARESLNAARFAPIVVFRAPDGSYRFPARSSVRTPAGMERVEMTNVQQVRRFENEMNARETARYNESQGRQREAYSFAQSHLRSDLRAKMRTMSQAGRDFAEAAMRRNDARSSSSSSYEPGFRVEVLSDDRSNRPEHRDRDTEWKARRA